MTNTLIAPLIAMPQGAEWLVILAIVVLVFGAAKLPDLARGTGQALRIFKAETKGLTDGDKDGDKSGDEEKSSLPTAQTDETPTTGTQPAEQADKSN